MAARIVDHPRFDTAVLVLILISSVLLTLSSPLAKKSDLMLWADLTLTVLFNVEMLLKVVALGFVSMEQPPSGNDGAPAGAPAYLRSGWNQLDFFIVIVSDVSS